MSDLFPALPAGWQATRDTLHAYAKFAGAVRRALAEPHPRWWHISLAVEATGLTTGEIASPEGEPGPLELTLDLGQHVLAMAVGSEGHELDLGRGLPAEELGDQVLAFLAERGVVVPVDRSQYAGDDDAGHHRVYEADHAAAWFQVLRSAGAVFRDAAGEMPPEAGPVQLWPHHFDLSFEWFGSRRVEHQEDGETESSQAQIGFGLSPGDESIADPYFYATPWPFDEALRAVELPPGAEWHGESFQGALLPYAAVRQGREDLLLGFIRRVWKAAAPGLSG